MPQYGEIRPRLVPVAGGITACGGADPLLLVTSVVFGVDGAIATARIRPTAPGPYTARRGRCLPIFSGSELALSHFRW